MPIPILCGSRNSVFVRRSIGLCERQLTRARFMGAGKRVYVDTRTRRALPSAVCMDIHWRRRGCVLLSTRRDCRPYSQWWTSAIFYSIHHLSITLCIPYHVVRCISCTLSRFHHTQRPPTHIRAVRMYSDRQTCMRPGMCFCYIFGSMDIFQAHSKYF